MKRLFFVLSFLLLAACSDGKSATSNEMKIFPTEFTKREIAFLDGLIGKEVLGYDISSIPNNHVLHIIVEHYHDGVKQENVTDIADSITEEQKLESFLIARETEEKGFSIKTLTLYESGVNSMVANGVYKKANSSLLFNQLEEEVTFTLYEEVVIGMVIEDDGDELMSVTLHKDDPKFQKTIETYQDVFIYKIFVSKD